MKVVAFKDQCPGVSETKLRMPIYGNTTVSLDYGRTLLDREALYLFPNGPGTRYKGDLSFSWYIGWD